MGDHSKIEWTEATWNPVTGCTKVSAGCDHCYIERTPPFRMNGRRFDGDGVGATTGVLLHPERLDQPLRWRKPRRVFVNSLSDLFHEAVPDEYIALVWAVMAANFQHDRPTHTFQVLTKRPARMRALLASPDFRSVVAVKAAHLTDEDHADAMHDAIAVNYWPIPSVWVGVSVEDQKWADIRTPALLDTPAAVRFLSCEPLLGPVSLCNCYPGGVSPATYEGPQEHCWIHGRTDIDWVICGGESGPGARPMHPDWARGLRDQCVAAGVPFFVKQRGEWTWNEPGEFRMPTKPYSDRVAVMHPAGMTALTKDNPFDPFERGHPNWATRIERVGKHAAGRELDGRTWDEMPRVGA